MPSPTSCTSLLAGIVTVLARLYVPAGMWTTGRWPLYCATAKLIACWICRSLEPTATSTTGRFRLGSVGGRVGSEGLIVLALTIELSISTSRPLVNIGLGTVNVFPIAVRSVSRAKSLNDTTGPCVTVLFERMTLSIMTYGPAFPPKTEIGSVVSNIVLPCKVVLPAELFAALLRNRHDPTE